MQEDKIKIQPAPKAGKISVEKIQRAVDSVSGLKHEEWLDLWENPSKKRPIIFIDDSSAPSQ